MNFSLKSILDFLKWVLRDPKHQAEIEAAEATLSLEEAVVKLPEYKRWQDAVKALAPVIGWSVVTHPETGAVTGIAPPVTVQPGGRPSGVNRGGLMPPGA